MEIGLSNGPGPPENPAHPTRPDRFWAGLRIFGLDFGSYFQVIFGFESASSDLYILVWTRFFLLKKKKPYSNKGLSPPPSPTSQVSISQNITAHQQCWPQTTHHSHHPRIVETTLQRRNGTAIYHQRRPTSSFQTNQNPRNKTHSDL